jgi:hypothetical protein
MGKLEDDPRIDPRLKAIIGAMTMATQADVANREELLAEVNRPEALAAAERTKAFLDLLDDESIAPSTGLDVSTHELTSSPDATR